VKRSLREVFERIRRRERIELGASAADLIRAERQEREQRLAASSTRPKSSTKS
jgi:hypothetical protein